MNRWVGYVFVVLIALSTGALSTLSFQAPEVAAERGWSELGFSTEGRHDDSLEGIITRGRWPVEAADEEEEDKPTGEFSSDYLLVGVVSTTPAYALLQPKHGENKSQVLTVRIGDVLDNGWSVAEISDAAVIAEREEEKQHVDLFSK